MTGLVDRFGRAHTYLRISITDRCNLSCRYCMPTGGVEWLPKKAILSFEEIERLVRALAARGVSKVRVTGGEPLVRRDALSLCRTLASVDGVQTLAMSTNAVLLADQAAAVRDAGVSHLNISLDTLRPDRFKRITGTDLHDRVLAGIDAAVRAGFEKIKINTVVMRGINDDEIAPFVAYAAERGLHVRFIEYMPFLGNGWNEATCMPYAEMRAVVEGLVGLEPAEPDGGVHATAKDFRVRGSEATVGFITTMTDEFCGGCNRLRITAEGKFRNCLFAQKEIDLRGLLRGGAADEQLVAAITGELAEKWERHPDAPELQAMQRRAMIAIGG